MLDGFLKPREQSHLTGREAAVWYVLTCWALFVLVSTPLQGFVGVSTQVWKVTDGPGIPYRDFPVLTLVILVGLGVLRTILMFSTLWELREISLRVSRFGFFHTRLLQYLRRAAVKLAIVGIIDIFGYSVAYASLAALEPRVSFDISMFFLLSLVVSPDKLIFAGFSYIAARSVQQGIELDHEAQLTV